MESDWHKSNTSHFSNNYPEDMLELEPPDVSNMSEPGVFKPNNLNSQNEDELTDELDVDFEESNNEGLNSA
ncbi:6185_t:CDS:2, partial [Gigaspora rosea]